MSVVVKTLPEFDRRAKRLAKKYKSFKQDLQTLVASLMQRPTQGAALGQGGIYKVRMSIAAKGGGKSGGARVLTYVIEERPEGDYEITLLTVYDKSEIQNVSNVYMASLIAELNSR